MRPVAVFTAMRRMLFAGILLMTVMAGSGTTKACQVEKVLRMWRC
jgi:hypothetical protein